MCSVNAPKQQKPLTEALMENFNRIETLRKKIDAELEAAKRLVEKRDAGEEIKDFDIRGNLYGLGLELAPDARSNDISEMKARLGLKGAERVVDLAAGTGFFTKEFTSWTAGEVIAVDPSAMQLNVLDGVCEGRATIVLGSPDNEKDMSVIGDGSVDVVSSFGGLHHVPNQRVMMEQISRILKPGGRFVAGDVGNGTSLASHFDLFVAQKCLTGHTAQWLDESRLVDLAVGLQLKLEKAEIVPIVWKFSSREEIALFFKALHAYDLVDEEIVDDLRDALGFEEKNGQVLLNWPMLFFAFVRE